MGILQTIRLIMVAERSQSIQSEIIQKLGIESIVSLVDQIQYLKIV